MEGGLQTVRPPALSAARGVRLWEFFPPAPSCFVTAHKQTCFWSSVSSIVAPIKTNARAAGSGTQRQRYWRARGYACVACGAPSHERGRAGDGWAGEGLAAPRRGVGCGASCGPLLRGPTVRASCALGRRTPRREPVRPLATSMAGRLTARSNMIFRFAGNEKPPHSRGHAGGSSSGRDYSAMRPRRYWM